MQLPCGMDRAGLFPSVVCGRTVRRPRGAKPHYVAMGIGGGVGEVSLQVWWRVHPLTVVTSGVPRPKYDNAFLSHVCEKTRSIPWDACARNPTHLPTGPTDCFFFAFMVVKTLPKSTKTHTHTHTAVRGPGGMRLRPGLHGSAGLSGRSLRPDVRARGQLWGSRLLCLRGRLVRPELHGARVLADLRQWRQLHGARHLHVRVGVVGRRRSRGARGARRRRRGGRRGG